MTYKYLNDPDTGKNFTTWIRRKSDGVNIRIDDANNEHPDYIEYKKWIEDGNTVEAADPGPSDWDLVREKRDDLLRASDWAMTTGATIDQAQWSAYREKLRDIPQTYKDKETSEIVWPTIPSSKGPNS